MTRWKKIQTCQQQQHAFWKTWLIYSQHVEQKTWLLPAVTSAGFRKILKKFSGFNNPVFAEHEPSILTSKQNQMKRRRHTQHPTLSATTKTAIKTLRFDLTTQGNYSKTCEGFAQITNMHIYEENGSLRVPCKGWIQCSGADWSNQNQNSSDYCQ